MLAQYSLDKQIVLRYLGAEVLLTDPSFGFQGQVEKVEQLKKEIPNVYVLDQFTNTANPEAHFSGTGPEIWKDTAGKVDIFVCGSGSGGSVTGAGKYLKMRNPSIKVICVEPAESPVISAWIAATIAVISSLCGTCNPKSPPKSSPKSPPSPPLNNEASTKPAETQILEQDQEQNSTTVPEEGTTVIEINPGVATHGPLPPVVVPASASRRKLSISLSSRLPEKLRSSRKERQEKAPESEETIWKKTIILGEKCKVPSDEDEEDEASRNYHPRTPRSRPMSRTNSFAIADAVHS